MRTLLIAPVFALLLASGCGAPSDEFVDDETGVLEQALAGDCARWVSDVNYPDYSYVTKGTWIQKKWKIKNCGTTKWTTSYGAAKVSGSSGFCGSFKLTGNVSPGYTATIWADCLVPNTAGQYSAYFRMADPNWAVFGDTFWVIVNAR